MSNYVFDNELRVQLAVLGPPELRGGVGRIWGGYNDSA